MSARSTPVDRAVAEGLRADFDLQALAAWAERTHTPLAKAALLLSGLKAKRRALRTHGEDEARLRAGGEER